MASHGVSRAADGPPRSEQGRQKEQAKIRDYQILVDAVNKKIAVGNLDQDALQLTSKLLTWNPEYYTIWNHRRRTVLKLLTVSCKESCDTNANAYTESRNAPADILSNDLAFLLPLLRKYPKCYWIWNYRLWLLEQATEKLPIATARQLWEQELGLVGKMLTLESRNFHGWGYRRTVIKALEDSALQSEDSERGVTDLEFEYTTKMVNMNLSNFSAWHNRSKVIPKLLNERHADKQARREILDEELELIQRALWAGDNDSSLWFYHHNLMCTFDPVYAPSSMAPDMSTEDRQSYVLAEFDKVLDMLDGAEDCKWIYQALINLSLLYQKLTGNLPSQAGQLFHWIETLGKIDPLRAGRWNDFALAIKTG